MQVRFLMGEGGRSAGMRASRSGGRNTSGLSVLGLAGAVVLGLGFAAWSAGPACAQEEAAAEVSTGEISIENFTVNGRFVRVVLSTSSVERDENGDPADAVKVRFVPADKGEAPSSTTLHESTRIDDWHDFTYEFREPFVGTMNIAHENAAGEVLASADAPIEFRDKVVQVYEETVGRAGGVLELIPGFAEPLVLIAEGFWDNPAQDLAATYEFTLEGDGADDFVIGTASYRADVALDIHWWGTLLTAQPGGEETEGGAEAPEAGPEADAAAAAAGDVGSPVKVVFQGGQTRIFVLAKPGADMATLVGRPTTSVSPLSPIRIELEGGVSRAGSEEPLVLERMLKYDGFWRVWLSTAEALESPWREDGGSLTVKALARDGEDWLETALPFSACDWVCVDDAGTCWTFTGHERELEASGPSRLLFELRDAASEVKGRLEIDVD